MDKNFNKEKNFVSAVVYVYNCEKQIGNLLDTISTVFKDKFIASEIICVNDNSTDNSVNEIKNFAELNKNLTITLLNMSYYHGLEQSMNAGIDLAIGDFVFEFDKQFVDYKEELIFSIYLKSLEGYDIVSAISNEKNKFSSSIFYKLFNKHGNFNYNLTTESFRVVSRRAINRAYGMNNSMYYRKVLYETCGLKKTSISYDSIRSGKDNIDKVEKNYRVNLAVDSLILFTDIGYKFSISMMIIMIFTSLFMFGYTIFIYITGTPIEGWTTTVLFLSFAFMGLFGILTIIVKYLQLTIDLLFKRKRYTFESIEKL